MRAYVWSMPLLHDPEELNDDDFDLTSPELLDDLEDD